MRKKYCKIALFSILVSLLALSSCVDNAYDLNKDIDMTISVGGSEFAIPGGYTDKWTLDQVLDLDTTGIIKTDANGNYALRKRGDDVAPTTVNIANVRATVPPIAPIIIQLKLKDAAARRSRAVATDSVVAEIPEGKKSTFILENDDMPVDLLSMSYATAEEEIITLEVHGPAKLSLRDMQILFPDYMDVEGVTNGVFQMPADATIGIDGVYTESLKVIGMRVGDAYNPAERTLKLMADIIVTGDVWMSKQDFNEAGGALRKDMVVNVSLDHMDIGTVTGRVNPEIDIKVEPVLLTDIPDFLNGDQVRLDLENPMILLHILNSSPVDVNAIGKLLPKKNNKAIRDTIYTGNIPIKGNFDNYICLSRTGNSSLPGYTNVKVEELSALLERIPDEIVFTVDAHSDTEKEFTILLGYDYEVQPAYELDAPLAFGENLQIVYNDTIDGWNSDIKDYEVSEINLHTDIDNGVPLNMILTAEAVDVNKNKVEGITVTVNKTIDAGTGDKSEGNFQITTTNGVIIVMKANPDTMKKLDGIILKAEAKSDKETVGKILNEDQYLQLRNIKLKVPGGLKIDLN